MARRETAAPQLGGPTMTTLPDRRSILAGLAAVAGAAATAPVAAAPEGLSFLVVGDWGRDGADHQLDVASQMEKAAAEHDTRFTVSVGDNFYDNGVQSTSDAQWKTSFENVYTGGHLQSPWYVVLGNHDYRGVPQAQVDYTSLSPRWRMPSRYYKVAGQDMGFADLDMFVIDSSPLVHEYAAKTGLLGANVKTQDTGAQLAWLDTALGESAAKYKLVFGHHTMFSGGSGHGNTPEMIARVLPILKKHGVLAYVNGHDHDLQHIERDGLHVICSGAGSEVRPVSTVDGTKFCLSQSGFSLFTVAPESVTVTFRNYLGQTVYKAELGTV